MQKGIIPITCIQGKIFSKIPNDLGSLLVWTVLLGNVQGYVPHAVHWLWAFSTPEYDRHVADHVVNDQWGNMLCNVPRPCHKSHPEFGLIKETIQRKGNNNFFNQKLRQAVFNAAFLIWMSHMAKARSLVQESMLLKDLNSKFSMWGQILFLFKWPIKN